MTANCYVYFLTTLVFTNNILILSAEVVLGEDLNEEFDFDGLPGAQHEFKVEVRAGTEECFYQSAKKGAKFHVSFEVLRGGDRKIDFFVKDPTYKIIASEQWKSDGALEKDIEIEGIYQVCLTNSRSQFSSKLIFLYIVVFKMSEWAQYAKDLSEIHDLATNFSIKLTDVQLSISEMFKFQTMSKMHDVKDWYTISSNNKYVGYWSMFQCVVIVTASGLQVYFVKRLFGTTNVTPGISQKP